MIQRDIMPETSEYETVNSTPSSMDDPSVNFLKYGSYLFSISIVLTLKEIIGRSFFSGSRNEYRNCALNVVDLDIFS